MTIPPGWTPTTLGQLGRYLNGRAFKKQEWGSTGRPIIRIQNLTGSSDTYNYFAGDIEDRYIVPRGTLLVSWAATLGAYFWPGPEGVLNQHIFKVESKIDPKFHKYLLDFSLEELQRRTHGSGMVHITRGEFDALPVAVPCRDKQCQIVNIIEEHLSHLDAADASLTLASRRLRTLTKSVLTDSIPDADEYPEGWERRTTATAGSIQLGRQRHPDWHTGSNMRPYLRVANVFEDRIDTSDVMEMHWSDGVFDNFRLSPGDVLLNEGQTPDLLGRSAIYRGDPAECAFTNSLIRFRAYPDVLPEFAQLVFRRHMHAGRFKRESRITTNIAHLSAARLKGIEFPVPPLAEQQRIVSLAESRLESIQYLEAGIRQASQRSQAARRAILSAAFSGRLASTAPGSEILEENAVPLSKADDRLRTRINQGHSS